ncbi:MAG: helix-turn-helix domain-containing protein [Pseudobdellovibrionaceae bacterium]
MNAAISSELKILRKSLGLTQMKLAVDSGVSLATIQNIEAGKANPSLSVLKSLFEVLQHDIVIQPQPIDWEELIRFGLPLTTARKNLRKQERKKDGLLILLKRALLQYPLAGKRTERNWEALAGFLLGLKTHFPGVFQELRSFDQTIQSMLRDQNPGRLYQLRRMSIVEQAKYL